MATLTPAQFRAKQLRNDHGDRGDMPTWKNADFETLQVLIEVATPAYAQAAATGRYVLGCHSEAGRAVIDLGTPEDLAQRTARWSNPPDQHLLIGGTTGSGKTTPAAA